MKKLLPAIALLAVTVTSSWGETVTTNGKEYEINTLIDREIGPGIRYTRLRLPDYPLNVNMLRIDVANPYNSVETTQANDRLYGTEALVNAAKRQTTDAKRVVAGTNANFWCVSGQPPFSDILVGLTYNANMRNGKIISELNMHSDQWNGGYKHTGIVGITEGNKVYSNNNYTWSGTVKTPSGEALTVHTVNKTVRDGELGIYNSYYGTSRTFKCVNQYTGTDNKQHFETVTNVATEVYLTMDPGQEWNAGGDLVFTVKEVKTEAGGGKLAANYDLAVVGRGDNATKLAALAIGEKLTLNYGFYNSSGNLVKFRNVVGGNAQVMKNSEMTKYATSEGYNSQVYSRTGMGTDADHKTLYMIVIDKSNDPVYGSSAGCSTTVMCDIAKVYGCVNMTNFDAGGSAEMLVDGAIINKTTESTPRAVANGLFAYSIAPKDDVITRLEFDDYQLQTPIYASYTPRILGYNQYGDLVSDNVQGFTLSCPPEAGTCDGMTFTAGSTPGTSTLTATLGTATVTKNIEIMQAQMAVRIKPILIDYFRQYPMEVTATVGKNTYNYNPASIEWTVEDPSVAGIDANGVLKGLKEGTTKVTAKLGEFTDETTVTVQQSQQPYLPVEPGEVSTANGWKVSKSGVGTVTLTPQGNNGGFLASFNVTSTRGTYVKLTKECPMYSLPDALMLKVNPGNCVFKNVVVAVQPATASREVEYTFTPTLTANQENDIEIDLKEFGDPKDLAFYPAAFKSVKFMLDNKTGNYSINMGTISGKYNNYTDGIEDITLPGYGSEDVSAGPAELYNLQGVRVDIDNAAPGVYISRRGNTVRKVIIK